MKIEYILALAFGVYVAKQTKSKKIGEVYDKTPPGKYPCRNGKFSTKNTGGACSWNKGLETRQKKATIKPQQQYFVVPDRETDQEHEEALKAILRNYWYKDIKKALDGNGLTALFTEAFNSDDNKLAEIYGTQKYDMFLSDFLEYHQLTKEATFAKMSAEMKAIYEKAKRQISKAKRDKEMSKFFAMVTKYRLIAAPIERTRAKILSMF